MKRTELIEKITDFQKATIDYSKLLLESRDSVMPDIVRNHDLIDESKSKLSRTFAGLEKYIVKFGNNPKTNDGVWNVMYSPYNNAFTSDVLVRVGPSIDMVIDDLNIVLGRLESVTDEEFENKVSNKNIKPSKLEHIHPIIVEKCKNLYEAGEYPEAVEKSFKIVKDRLREITGFEKGSDAFGKGGLYIKGAVANNVDEDFNKAVQLLMMAIDRFKNEKGHTSDANIDDPTKAYQYLAMSSLALSFLDNFEIRK